MRQFRDVALGLALLYFTLIGGGLIGKEDITCLLINRFLIFLLLLFWLGESWIKGRSHLPKRTPLDFPILALVGGGVLSYIFSSSRIVSEEELFNFLSYIFLYYFITSHISKREGVIRLITLIIIPAILIAIVGVGQYLFFLKKELNLTYQVHSILGNVNILGGYLILIIPLSLSLYLISPSKLLSGSIFILLLFCLLLTFSRGSYLGGGISLIVFGVLYQRKRKKVPTGRFKDSNSENLRLSNLSKGWLVTLLGIIVFTFLTLFIAQRLFPRVPASNRERILIWQSSLRMLKEHPLVGSGPGTFGLIYPDFQIKEYIPHLGWNRWHNHAHNLFLQLGAEGGILNLGLFIWLLITFFKKGYQSLSQNPKAKIQNPKQIQNPNTTKSKTNPKSKYYQIQNKSKIQNPKKLDFGPAPFRDLQSLTGSDLTRDKPFDDWQILLIGFLSSITGLTIQGLGDYLMNIPLISLIFWIILALITVSGDR